MLENTNYEAPETGLVVETSINLESIEDFMSAFGITQIATQKDEGLLSKDDFTIFLLSTFYCSEYSYYFI